MLERDARFRMRASATGVCIVLRPFSWRADELAVSEASLLLWMIATRWSARGTE